MDGTTMLNVFLLLVFVFLMIMNGFNAKKMNRLEQLVFEAYRDSDDLREYIQRDLQATSQIEAIKQVRIKYGLSIEHAKYVVDKYKGV